MMSVKPTCPLLVNSGLGIGSVAMQWARFHGTDPVIRESAESECRLSRCYVPMARS
jgi:hypothetical protein